MGTELVGRSFKKRPDTARGPEIKRRTLCDGKNEVWIYFEANECHLLDGEKSKGTGRNKGS